MTQPTQAQIEAAAKALHSCEEFTDYDWDKDMPDQVKQFYRDKAAAALTAAAEAGENPLAEKVRQLTKLLDDQLSTPCEQIRHQQEIQATIERCAQVAWEQLWRDHRGIAEKVVAAIRALNKP